MLFWPLLGAPGKTPHPVVLFFKFLRRKSDCFPHFSGSEKTISDPSLNQPNLVKTCQEVTRK